MARKTANPAVVGILSLLAIAVISVLAFNVAPFPEPMPSENVPLGFSALVILGILLVIAGLRRKA